ncbi:MAG: HlyD family secretion protein [Minwuia sp.]|uniref:HlyD family secretion protein n=1 Tax=Minwuia sp. TaxID=2493630 RepID=UPI003A869FA2
MTDAPTEEKKLPPRRSRSRRLARYVVPLIALVIIGYFVQDWVIRRQTHVYIIDSRIASDMITVGAQEGGLIVDLTVGTGDAVQRGNIMVRMDRRALAQEVRETEAEITRVTAEKSRVGAEIRLEEAKTGTAENSARARISVADAARKSVEALLTQARQDRKRAEDLFRRKVISSQSLEDARAREADLEARSLQARAGIVEASAELDEAKAARDSATVLREQLTVLDAEREALEARLEQLKTRLSDRDVPSLIDGVIDQTFIEIGEYVRPGQRLLMMHDPGNVWVAANVKETELHRFDVGSVAKIKVDAFPGRDMTGTVTWIAPAATSQFALLPNPNPSGNFTKVTQRVPVRIDLDGDLTGLRPGMMVEVAIDVFDW